MHDDITRVDTEYGIVVVCGSTQKHSLVPTSQNGLVHEVEFLGFMGGAMSLLIA